MKIWASRYTLQSRSALGVARPRSRLGALLKIEDENGDGHADLHPWPELGDLPLDAQLEALANGHHTPLVSRSLALASLDRDPRARNVSAFSDNIADAIPESHFLVTDLEALSPDTLQRVWAEGFRVLKLKLGGDLQNESQKILELRADLAAFALRFDFNARLTPGVFLAFIGSLPSEVRAAIEFTEDPVPWSPVVWSELHEASGVDLAFDRPGRPDRPDGSGTLDFPESAGKASLQWLVLKPAIQDPDEAKRISTELNVRLVVTTYLDHPIGQYGAALEAARLRSRFGVEVSKTCGLMSHIAFEKSEFIERVIADGPKLLPPEGTGLGFDDLLAKQDWKRLK